MVPTWVTTLQNLSTGQGGMETSKVAPIHLYIYIQLHETFFAEKNNVETSTWAYENSQVAPAHQICTISGI